VAQISSRKQTRGKVDGVRMENRASTRHHSRRKISRRRVFPFTPSFAHGGNNEMRRCVEYRPMMASMGSNTVEIVADRELGS